MLALYSLLPTLLSAHGDRGGMSGRITDNTGAILASTPITLRNEDTGVVQTTVTNSAGVYSFGNLNPGSYSLTIKRTGFRNVERNHTVVDVNQVNQQHVSLEGGTASATVEVTTGVEQLHTSAAAVGLDVEHR